MRQEFLVDNWLFHKGDIRVNRPVDKGLGTTKIKIKLDESEREIPFV